MEYTTKTSFLLLLGILLGVAGCGGKKKCLKVACEPQCCTEEAAMPTQQKSPEAQQAPEEVEEFALVDDLAQPTATPPTACVEQKSDDALNDDNDDEFSWIEDEEEKSSKNLQTVYFDFDRYAIKKDQETAVANNAEQIKKLLTETTNNNTEKLVVVEGHADHAAGSAAYNMALSEKRAKVLADALVTGGIPRNAIKIVGRGQECPALGKDGKPVDGSRDQQWPNRRAEVNVIQS